MSRSGKRGPRALHGDRPHVGELPVRDDVKREVAAHLDLLTEDLVREGWEPAAAREEARRRFGDVDAVRQECETITRSRDRGVRRAHRREAVMQDLKYAVRSLVRSPGFTAVALLTLAMGIGANTVIFSVVNGVLLRPLPYADSHELMMVSERSTRGGSMDVAWPNFRDWRESSRSFEGLTAYTAGTATVLGGQDPTRATVTLVTSDFWSVFGVEAVQGRLTTPDDHRPGANPAAVVTRSLAQRLFGTDAGVGRVVEVRGVRAEVVGVVEGFSYPSETELWTPLEPTEPGESRSAHNFEVVGRLRDGVSRDQAFAEIDPLTRQLVAAEAEEDPDYLATGAHVRSLQEETVGDVRRPLLLLLGAAGFVLLVACTNLASTHLARGTVRARELAVRSSLGAGKGRLVRQLLTESAVLAGLGGVLGVVLTAAILGGIRTLGEGSIPRIDSVRLDPWVLLFTALVTVVTGVIFGLLPALRLSDGAQASSLRSEGRGSAGRRGGVWSFLVASEVALALVLLVGAGLLIRSFSRVLNEEAGFDASDVALTSVAPSNLRYPDLESHRLLWDRLLTSVSAAPEVEAAGIMSTRPVAGFVPNGRVALDGDPTKHGDGLYVVASEGAFEALDIPLVRGRFFDERDGPDQPHVVVVSQSFANRYWPGENPLGRQVSGGGMDNYWNAETPVFGTVVGVVGEVRYRELGREGEPTVYWSYRQRPFRIQYGAILVAEAAMGDPTMLAPVFRRLVRAADPDIAVEPRFLKDLVGQSVADRRFVLMVLGGFAALALVLAAVGIYGVVSYTVARRTREMGIRLALGADRSGVLRLVFRGALGMVLVGIVAGLGAALAVTRLLRSLLYEVEPTDPLTLAAVTGILVATAGLATWIPALRSTRVDPIEAMRAE